MQEGFEPIGHTSDIGIKVWAKNIEALFCYAAAGMSALMISLEDVKPVKSKNIVVKGNDLEELLVDWLNEIINIFAQEKLVFSKYSVKIDPKNMVLKAKCSGEVVDTSVHEVLTEIKAATFSGLKIKKQSGKFETTVIFDV